MNITLLICIISDIILLTILILLIIEVFVFEKALQKQGISFVINLGNVINKCQLKEIFNLLKEENEDYKEQVSRIIIYGYKWQYLFFYLIRVFLAHIYKQEELENEYKKVMKRDSHGLIPCGGYLDKFDIIEIYEFNMKKIQKSQDIDIYKVQLTNAIAHEFRHRIQHNKRISVIDEEADAEGFAIDFCNKNKHRIKEILNLASTVTFKKIYFNH
ncbi:MAG: hypothetical protein GX272_00525 [Epulopiscium sp.]|nr:hypothetical protein [Candidatus Epulonipiscium sp.]